MKYISGKTLKEKTNVQFVKVLRSDFQHRDFTYKIGLNEISKFHHISECSSGGLYFTDLSNVKEWASFGEFVHVIEIPDDAKVIVLSTKYKADKFILQDVKIETKELIDLPFDFSKMTIEEILSNTNFPQFWMEQFEKHKNINKIPNKRITEEMVKGYVENSNTPNNIPNFVLTDFFHPLREKFWLNYYVKWLDIDMIPREIVKKNSFFIQEFINITGNIEKIFDNFDFDIDFNEFNFDNVVKKTKMSIFIDKCNEFKKTPKRFRNDFIKKWPYSHFKCGNDEIDSYYQACWINFYNKTKCSKDVPKCYRSQEMWSNYYNLYKNIDEIPNEFRTSKMK